MPNPRQQDRPPRPQQDFTARDREQWRRGRAQAWDRFACVSLQHFMENSRDAEEREGAPIEAASYADMLLAARDQRFGKE